MNELNRIGFCMIPDEWCSEATSCHYGGGGDLKKLVVVVVVLGMPMQVPVQGQDN
jgi:hypothetical protein